MGTLFNQPERNYRRVTTSDVEYFLEDAIKISKKLKISLSDVIEAQKILELERQNSLYVENGDAHDEQMKGVGEIIQQLAESVRALCSDD